MADIISQFIYNLGAWITVFYFSPLHTIISENVENCNSDYEEFLEFRKE